MAKKKGKANQPKEDNPKAFPKELNESSLEEREAIDQLRRLWAETNPNSEEPTDDDFRLMLEAVSNLHDVDSDSVFPEWLDEDSSAALASQNNSDFDELNRDGDFGLDDGYDNGIPLELLPEGYSEANDILSGFSPELDIDAKLQLCLKATTRCRQLVGGWILASNYAEDDSRRAAYLLTAIEEAEWFYDASKSNSEYQEAFEDEYVAATLDATFHLWRLGQRDVVLAAHEKLDSRFNTDIQGHRTVHSLRRYEQEEFDLSRIVLESLSPSACSSVCVLHLLNALHQFRLDSKSELAGDYLRKAAQENTHILDIFLGDGYWHESYIVDFEAGSEEEAYWVATIGGAAIRSTEGFVRFMRNTLNYIQEPSVTPENDFKRQIQMLASLPLEPSTWILESKQLAASTYCTFVYDVNQEELLSVEADEDKPTNARLWDVLVQTMLDGQNQEPHRPTQLILTKQSLAQSWQKRCRDLEIDCEFDADAGLPDDMMEGLLDVINKVDQDVHLTDENWEKAKELPKSDEIWHVGIFQPPIWISDEATPRKSCVALVIDEESEMIRIHDLMESRPTADYLARTIMKGMFFPLSENMEPSIPATLKVHPHTIPETVSVFQENLGIEIEPCDVEEESLLDNAVEHLILHCSDPSMRESLFDCCEITESQLRVIYVGIRDFYNASVWKWIPSERIIEISFPNGEHEPFYVCVIGQSGFHFGIVCSDEVENLRVMSNYESETDDETQEDGDDDSDEADVTFLNFGESHEIPPIDLWYIEQFDFDVASADAYPLIQRFVSDQRYRRPNRLELDQVAFAVKAIPALKMIDMPKEGVTIELDFFYHQSTVHVRWCGSA